MTKYSLMPDVRMLEKGSRFVVDAYSRYQPGGDSVRLPAAVLTYMGDMPARDFSRGLRPKADDAFAVASDGTRYDLAFDHSGDTQPVFIAGDVRRRAVWTLPVPDASDNEIIAFTEAFRGVGQPFGLDRSASPHANNALFIVDSVDDRFVRCRMVTWGCDATHDLVHIEAAIADGRHPIIRDDALHFVDLETFREAFTLDRSFAFSSYEICVRNRNLPPLSAGSLLVCSDFWCRYDKAGVLRTNLRTPMVAGHLGERSLEQWLSPLPARQDGVVPERIASTFGDNGRRNIPLAAIQDHLKEIERAKAASIPSEALVLVMPGEEGEDNSFPPIVRLGSRGVTFFDDIGDTDEYLSYSAPREGGLWVITNARYWSHRDDRSGEWDGGLDGDWRPATSEDLASFEITESDVQAEAEDAYEGVRFKEALKSCTFCTEMMSLAFKVDEKDRNRFAAGEMSAASKNI